MDEVRFWAFTVDAPVVVDELVVFVNIAEDDVLFKVLQ